MENGDSSTHYFTELLWAVLIEHQVGCKAQFQAAGSF